MKKLIALLLSLAMIFTCAAVLADAAEEADEYQVAHYQFRNATGEAINSLVFKDNVTGEEITIIAEDEPLTPDTICFLDLSVDAAETKEALEHRYTVTFTTVGGYKGEFATLSFENVLIDLLAADAVTGATPIKFNLKMYQLGNYKIVNNTSKVLSQVTITENADTNNNATVAPAINPGDSAVVDFTIDPENEPSHALTIEFTFEDGTKCSFGTLSIEEASLTLTDDAITGATPFAFGPLN